MTVPAARPVPAAPQRHERVVLALFLAASFAQLVSLPMLLTWDGYQYLELAEILGSPRYPEEWYDLRTPLFPLALKLSFAAFGRNPLAAQAVPFSLGVLGCLVLASAVRSIAGPRTAAATLIALGFYPTLAAFEHAILGETGTFFFLAVLLRLSVWSPSRSRDTWLRAGGLALVLSIGYLWRQSILFVAPWVGLLHLLSLRRFRRPAVFWGLHVLLLAAPPVLTAQIWTSQFDPERLARRDAGILRFFALRQMVLPPDHPSLAAVRDDYRRAIDETLRGGPLSGIPWSSLVAMEPRLPPLPEGRGGAHVLFSIAGDHPGRYLAGFGRSLLFFAGFDAIENEVAIFSGMVLSPSIEGSIIGEGPPGMAQDFAGDLTQHTGSGIMKSVLHALRVPYHGLVIIASLLCVAGLLWSAIARDGPLAAVIGVPVVFAGVHAALLLSINRFMVPVYPIVLAGLLILVARTWSLFRRRAAPSSGC